MDLDTLIIAVYCLMDDLIPQLLQENQVERLRRRGPEPKKLSDQEVLTMEIVGAYLGYSEDLHLFDYFRRHWSHYFPGLSSVHRSTFVRQAANLWKLKEQTWRKLLASLEPDPAFTIADSLPVPVCRFARAPYCQRFKGDADYGYDHVARQTYFGFRLHALVGPAGLIHCIYLTPAHEDEKKAVEDMTEEKQGIVLGDRNFWSPDLFCRLRERGVKLIAPYKHKSRDPHPSWSAALSKVRYRIETVFGQLTDRYHLKRVWARKPWQLANRLLRCVLSHTVAFYLNRQKGNPPLQLSLLLS